MVDEPAAVPIRVQLPPPFLLAQRPCWATPAMSRSSSGLEDRFERFPHSEPSPARLPVALAHCPLGFVGSPPASPQEVAYWMAPESTAPLAESALGDIEASTACGSPSTGEDVSALSDASAGAPASGDGAEPELEQPARRTAPTRASCLVGWIMCEP